MSQISINMHYKFAETLLSYRQSESPYYETGDRCVIIVETRQNYWLPAVVNNVIERLPGWKIYIVGSNCSIEYLRSKVTHKLNFVLLPNENLPISQYNRLFLSTTFWEAFKEESVLIVQPDCLILREPTEKHLKHPFIGAVCYSQDEHTFIMNGGLSLRKRSVMLKICSTLLQGNENQPEDVVFSNIIRKHRLGMPSMDDCNSFAIESFGDISSVVGIHGTDKGYLSSNRIDEIFEAIDTPSDSL